MAGRLAELIVKIGSDVSGFGKGVREVSAELDKMVASNQSAMRGFSAISQQMSDVGSRLTLGMTLPMAALGAAAIKADADMDSLMRGLVAVTGSAGAAEQQFARLEAVAKLPGLGMREAVQGAINLQAAGLSAELAERALKAFGNALATVGKGKADLDGVILALGQIQSKGKISAEEINQLAERVPQIRQAMKSAFGTADTEALSKMGLSATQFVEQVTAEFEKLKQVTGGVKNGFENVQDAIQKSLSEIGKSLRPATEELLKFLEPAIAKTADLAKEFQGLPAPVKAGVGAVLAVGMAAPPALAAIGQLGLGIVGLSTGWKLLANGSKIAVGAMSSFAVGLSEYLVPAAGAATTALTLLSRAAMLTGIVYMTGEAIAGIYKVAQAWMEYSDSTDKAEAATKQQNDSIQVLRIQLHQANVSTDELDASYRRGELTIQEYGKGLLKLVDAHAKVQAKIPGTAAHTANLTEAFKSLGIESSENLTKKLNDAKAALAIVQDAFKAGKATALDLANAQDVVKRAYEALHPPMKQVSDTLGKMQGPQTMFEALDMSSRTAAAMQKEAAEQLERVADILSGKGFDLERFPFAVSKVGDQLEQASSVARIVSKYWTDLWDEIANTQAAQRAEAGLRQLAISLGVNVDKYKELAEAKKRLGLGDEKNLGQMAADVATLKSSGSPKYQTRKAEIDFLNEKRRQGIDLTKDEEVALRQLQKEASAAAKETVSVWTEIQQRLKAVFQDVSKNIVDLAFEGGKFKDVILGALEEIGKGLARLALEKTLAAIGAQLSGIITKIPGLAKIGGLLGIGGKTAETATSAAASAAGAASSAASQAAGIASKAIGTSFTAMAGVVTGAISAVSGVIGNFQMAGMNKTLDLIEWNTRKTSLHAEHTLLKINEGIPGFREVQDRLSELRDVLIGWDQYISGGLAIAGGGGSGITINMAGSNFIGFRDLDAFLDELARRLKQRGV